MACTGTITAISLLLIVSNAGESNAQCTPTNPCVEELGQGKDFQQPEQLYSVSSKWSIDMDVDIGDVEFGWLKLKRRMYNGRPVGPTWNVKKGDEITLTLTNKLSDLNNEQDKPPNDMNHPNTTNMHTHGLHISAMDPQDNVLVSVKPGKDYTYIYTLHEKNPSGTLWYHAHVHESTMFQVHSGMSGMLIVEDEVRKMPWELEAASCPFNCDSDIQMLFQPLLQYGGFLGFGRLQDQIGDDPYFKQDDIITNDNITLTQWLADNVNLVTVNGLLQPVLKMVHRRMYRFRMVNGAGFDTLEVFITKKGTNEPATGCEIREIALDGVYLDRPRKMHDGQTLLAPGQRTDWLVKCNTRGTYELRSFPKDDHKMSIAEIDRWSGLLVTLEVGRVRPRPPGGRPYHGRPGYGGSLFIPGHGFVEEMLPSHGPGARWGYNRGGRPGRPRYGSGRRPFGGSPWRRGGFRWNVPFPLRLPRRPWFVKDLRNVKEEDIKERFVMEFNTRLQLNRLSWSGPDNYRYAMTVNKIQEWHVVNTDNVDSHPLHIHINHFQVISYNNYTGGFSLRFENDYVLYNQDDLKPCYHQRDGLDEIFEEEVPEDALDYLGHEVRYEEDAGNTLGYARVGDWRDTLLIPPLSNITIRFIPERYTGDCIIHCHILGHEDAGMMMITKIVEEGESLDANITSGEAYPGTCRECDRYPFNNPQTLCDLTEEVATVAADPRSITLFTPPKDQSTGIPTLWQHKIRPRGEGQRRSFIAPVRVPKPGSGK